MSPPFGVSASVLYENLLLKVNPSGLSYALLRDEEEFSLPDMSFAIQALSLEHLVKDHAALQPKVYNVPEELDQMVARTKLEVMGVRIDELTAEQRKYLHGWQEGT